MAAMEEAMCAYLLTKSSVTDIIGTGDAARLWPMVLPQGYSVSQGPAATYEILPSEETHTISDRSGLVNSRVQITAFAATYASANALARAIKNCGIVALKGVFSGVNFRGISIIRGLANFEEIPTDGSQEHRYLTDFDFSISYWE